MIIQGFTVFYSHFKGGSNKLFIETEASKEN